MIISQAFKIARTIVCILGYILISIFAPLAVVFIAIVGTELLSSLFE